MAKITFKINTLEEVEEAIKVLKGIKKAKQPDPQAAGDPPPPPPPTGGDNPGNGSGGGK